jgi:hypothetical protein
MSATKVSPTDTGTTTSRSVRSVLDGVMLVGLFIVVVADGVAQILEGAIIPPVLIFQALYLLCGIVVATRWRWAMLLPLVVCPLGIVADFASGFPEYTLTHPGSNAVAFGAFVLEYPLLALVIGGSVIKLVQTVRREPWLWHLFGESSSVRNWLRWQCDDWLERHRDSILLYMRQERWLPRKDILFHLANNER